MEALSHQQAEITWLRRFLSSATLARSRRDGVLSEVEEEQVRAILRTLQGCGQKWNPRMWCASKLAGCCASIHYGLQMHCN